MKIFGIAFAALGLLSAPAMGADMAVKAPPPAPAPASSWTGFYLGVDGGYGWNENTGAAQDLTPAGVLFGAGTASPTGSVIRPGGGLVGGEAGYNWQSGVFLIGIETDIQWSGIKSTATVPQLCNAACGGAAASYTASAKMDWFGTTRARIGVLSTPNLLLYVTGGGIYAHESATATSFFAPTFIYPSAGSTTRGGGVVGGGFEYLFTRNLSAKIEGLYYDMGRFNTAFTCPPGAATCAAGFTAGGTFAMRGEIIRAGLNWHFNTTGAAK